MAPRHCSMPHATAQCPMPRRAQPNAQRIAPRAQCPAPRAAREMLRAKCRAPSAPHPVPRAQCPRPMPRVHNAPRREVGGGGGGGGRVAAVELSCVGAARRRTVPFAPAAVAAGAFSAVADTFGWELDTRPKNRLPLLELPPKLNLQLLAPRPALLPLLLLPSGPSPAFSIARRSSTFQATERRSPSATAFFCPELTPWLRLGWGATCSAADGPAAAAAAPSASSCAGLSTASGVAITRTNLLARAGPVLSQ